MISKMNSFIHRNSKTNYQSENESEAIFGKLKNNNSLKQEIMWTTQERKIGNKNKIA